MRDGRRCRGRQGGFSCCGGNWFPVVRRLCPDCPHFEHIVFPNFSLCCPFPPQRFTLFLSLTSRGKFFGQRAEGDKGKHARMGLWVQIGNRAGSGIPITFPRSDTVHIPGQVVGGVPQNNVRALMYETAPPTRVAGTVSTSVKVFHWFGTRL